MAIGFTTYEGLFYYLDVMKRIDPKAPCMLRLDI
jgi:hypothetical protein